MPGFSVGEQTAVHLTTRITSDELAPKPARAAPSPTRDRRHGRANGDEPVLGRSTRKPQDQSTPIPCGSGKARRQRDCHSEPQDLRQWPCIASARKRRLLRGLYPVVDRQILGTQSVRRLIGGAAGYSAFTTDVLVRFVVPRRFAGFPPVRLSLQSGQTVRGFNAVCSGQRHPFESRG